MKTVPGLFLNESRHGTCQRASVALFLLGFLIAFAVADPGPVAPLLASGTIHLVAFPALLLPLFWLQVAVCKVFSTWFVA